METCQAEATGGCTHQCSGCSGPGAARPDPTRLLARRRRLGRLLLVLGPTVILAGLAAVLLGLLGH